MAGSSRLGLPTGTDPLYVVRLTIGAFKGTGMTDAEKVDLLERCIQLMDGEIQAPSDGQCDGYITLDGTARGLSKVETDYLFTINER